MAIQTEGKTPRAILSDMQDAVSKMYTEVGDMEGSYPARQSLMIALIDVMSSLDIAVNRAGRV